MTRHIELTFDDFDLTCWGEDEADFEADTMDRIEEAVADYFIDTRKELLDRMHIRKVWYEND